MHGDDFIALKKSIKKPKPGNADLHYMEEKDPRQMVARERAERAATEAYEAERNERMDALDRQIRQRPDATRTRRR